MECNIEWPFTATPEEQPYFLAAIKALQHPEPKPEMVVVTEDSLHNKIYKDFPSTSHFKHVMDLPLLKTWETNASKELLNARKILQIIDGPVYFMSTDCSPVIELQWKELIQYADTIFDDSRISLIFTDPGYNWVIFHSIEYEWRCGFTKTKK